MNSIAHITPLMFSGPLKPASLALVIIVTLVFVTTVIVNIFSVRRFRRKSAQTRQLNRIMQFAMETEQIVVLRIKPGENSIVNVYGDALPEEGITIKEYMDDVHPDDHQELSHLITQLSLGRQKSAELHYRRRFGGIDGKWQWRYIVNNAIAEGRSAPYDVLCTLKDETNSHVERQQEEDLSRRYQSIFEHSVVGLAIYDRQGMLLATNENMRRMLRMEEGRDRFFYDVSLFNRQPFRELVSPDEVREYHLCTKMVMPERNLSFYMELQLKPQLDDTGQVLHYSLAARDVTEEREFYLKNRHNDEQIRRANEEIQRYETELQYLMDKCDMRVWRADFHTHEITIYKSLDSYERRLSFTELQKYFIDNTDELTEHFAHPEKYFCKPVSFVRRMRSIIHKTDELHWNIMDSIPIFDSHGKLEGTFGIIRNITPLIEAQELLKEETRRANDSTRLKSVFMANMTHEIRTPLNSIIGFSDLLPMIDDPEQKQEMVRVILNNCDMLLRLINDVLELSTIDGKGIIIRPETVDFAKLFDTLCDTLSQRVDNPAVSFIKENPYSTLPLAVDQKRIQQVVTNFVTNAVKYTHQGHIRLGYRVESSQSSRSSRSSQNTLYIYCEDTGVGIPKEKQGSIFDRFVKLNDYVQGTGLGLSICKAIADRYNGEIGVDSEGEGHGSTFWLRVPI